MRNFRPLKTRSRTLTSAIVDVLNDMRDIAAELVDKAIAGEHFWK